MLTVADLIRFLQTQPQDLPVIYDKYSEHLLMTTANIRVGRACHPRDDEWVARERPDKPSQEYLIFPGN